MGLVRAKHRYARISATKVRPFTNLISGLSVSDALGQLKYLPNRGARNVDSLKIVEARVDGGPMMKRIQPRARGMAFQIQKKMSHIHVTIEAPELP